MGVGGETVNIGFLVDIAFLMETSQKKPCGLQSGLRSLLLRVLAGATRVIKRRFASSVWFSSVPFQAFRLFQALRFPLRFFINFRFARPLVRSASEAGVRTRLKNKNGSLFFYFRDGHASRCLLYDVLFASSCRPTNFRSYARLVSVVRRFLRCNLEPCTMYAAVCGYWIYGSGWMGGCCRKRSVRVADFFFFFFS